jgi:hypothetical protein
MFTDIIAAAIADGSPVADAMPAAQRVLNALAEAGALTQEAQPYVPKAYPKYVHGHVVKTAAEEEKLLARFAPMAPATPATTAAPAETAAPATT